jgi:hypothetical protein
VKVTGVPSQKSLIEAVIFTVGVTAALTVMVMLFDVAAVGDAQDSDEVMVQLTTSPFAKLVEVKVLLFEPAFTPFTTH